LREHFQEEQTMSDGRIGDGMEHVQVLAGEIGKRNTGSEGERRAAEYMCEQLKSWGFAEVGTEPFQAKGWDFECCSLEAEGIGTLDALPIEYSGSTLEEGVEGELVVCESPGDVEMVEVRDRILLVNGGIPAAAALLERGAAGLIVASSDKPRAWHLIYGPEQPLAGKLPMVTVGFGDAVELLKRGVTRLRLKVKTTIGEVTGLNVVGTLPGQTARRLNVSGHYDSVVSGPAAADNATGAACALEVAHALSRQPLNSALDVAIFSAEEIGLYGAEAYVQGREELLQQTELGVYFDGQGDFLGRNNIHALGQEGLAEMVREISREIGYQVDVRHHFTGLDQVFLSAHGVPTLWFQRGPQLTWHTPADGVEDVSPEAMRRSIGAAVEILRQVDAQPDCFPGGIPEEQTRRIEEYLAKGAPVW
jgi:aminopeptidase YwaD